MVQWLVIGISGVTCGGKTTLAHNLHDHFSNQRNLRLWNTSYLINDVQLMSQDDYFLPVDDLRHQWFEQLNVINFEVITALDMKQMLSDIMWLMKGRYLACSHADLPKSSCKFKSSKLPSKEQCHALSSMGEHFKDQFDAKIAHMHSIKQSRNLPITTSITQMQEKRINILIIEGFLIFNQPELLKLCNIKFHFHLPYDKCFERRCKRTYDPPDITGYFEMCVWPYYEKNFAELKDNKDIIILNGEISKHKILSYALQRIAEHFEERCNLNCPSSNKLLEISSCNNNENVSAITITIQ